MSSAQLSLAWVASLGNVVPIPGSSKVARIKENFASADIVLTHEDLKEIQSVVEGNTVQGGRYPAGHAVWA